MQYSHLFKPKGCPVRKTEPRGPLKGCEGTCLVFEACVELTRDEIAFEALKMKELERLHNLGRESLNPLRAS